MIEINLIPDVKRELLKAQSVRSTVISASIILAIAALAIVVLLVAYVFGAQTIHMASVDGRIKEQNEKLLGVEDLANTLTVQNQLSKISETHDAKNIYSRLRSLLFVIDPSDPYDVSYSKVLVSSEDGIITIEAQAREGYTALEIFKKTIAATKLQYTSGAADEESAADTTTIPLAPSEITVLEKSYGEDAAGFKTLRFKLSFEYAPELFAPASQQATIIGPEKRNVTDSFVDIPKSLFTTRAKDLGEDK